MERAALLSRGELVLPEHLPNRLRTGPTAPTAAPVADAERLEEVERQVILQTLKKHDYNRTDTAKSLGISRRALLYKLQAMRKLGLPVDQPPQ